MNSREVKWSEMPALNVAEGHRREPANFFAAEEDQVFQLGKNRGTEHERVPPLLKLLAKFLSEILWVR